MPVPSSPVHCLGSRTYDFLLDPPLDPPHGVLGQKLYCWTCFVCGHSIAMVCPSLLFGSSLVCQWGSLRRCTLYARKSIWYFHDYMPTFLELSMGIIAPQPYQVDRKREAIQQETVTRCQTVSGSLGGLTYDNI
jgi:hypothetical protein